MTDLRLQRSKWPKRDSQQIGKRPRKTPSRNPCYRGLGRARPDDSSGADSVINIGSGAGSNNAIRPTPLITNHRHTLPVAHHTDYWQFGKHWQRLRALWRGRRKPPGDQELPGNSRPPLAYALHAAAS